DEVAAQKSGADSYITKPVNYVQLVTQLQRFLPYTRGEKEAGDQLTETETVYTEKKALSPGLLEALETELSDTWESIRGVYVFDDIDTFATRVIKLGEENSLEILTRWGKRLHEQVQTFDMERLPETLDYFPQLMKKIEQAGKGN
ncbi:MAG: hypothetical protein GY757_32910, partial [bacterium]|nr:hypothetical protein [bacterium]